MTSSNNTARSSRYRIGGAAVAAGTVIVILRTLEQLLQVPSGYGVEDFLGWTGVPAVTAMQAAWASQLGSPIGRWVAWLYLVLDIGLFMPLYALVLAAAWCWARSSLMRHSSREGNWGRWIARLGGSLVLTLLLIDLVENVAGLDRLGLAWTTPAGPVLFIFTVAWIRRVHDATWLQEILEASLPMATGESHLRPLSWWLPIVVLGTALAFVLSGRPERCADAGQWLWALGCSAHALKSALVFVLLGGPVAIVVWVQFGPHADEGNWSRVVAARSALAGTVWRSRYVLAALGACTALMLVMDQGRDVIYALASHPWSEGAAIWPAIQTVLVMGETAVALWILGFACWLWARMGVMVARRPDGNRRGPARAEDVFARDWARALGVAPGLLVLGLTLATLPNAVVLPNKGPIFVLVLFATLVLAGSVAFIWKRDMLAKPRTSRARLLYYASMTRRRVVKASGSYRLFGFIGPTSLPAAALVLGLACRAISVLAPVEWGIPTQTLPIMLCLVTFWLSLAGWVSLYEHSESVPWFVFGVVWVGALGIVGWAENHRVPIDDNGVTLSPAVALAIVGLLALLLLSIISIVLLEAKRQDPRQRVFVWSGAVVLLLGLALIVASDRRLSIVENKVSAPAMAITTPVALAAWLKGVCDLPNSHASPKSDAVPPSAERTSSLRCAPGRKTLVHVIASEGGGIRSAYWTALALEQLWLQDPGFESRTFAMTGVSGGALGLAVFRACRTQASAMPLAVASGERSAADKVKACIEKFGSTDLLSPLVGAWFFEDAVARWLPTKLCKHPGCGFMSRGLWFEQAMLSAVPEMAQGLIESRKHLESAGQGHTPYLFLNSTWVESGERSLASELVVDWHLFPGARDQVAELGRADLPLVTAAHNSSRFPFTNALGAVQVAKDRCTPNAYLKRDVTSTGEPERCGHLADGGYFDNSGGHTAVDLLRLLRTCLSDTSSESNPACPSLAPLHRKSLSERLQPQLIVVRNGVPPPNQRQSSCAEPQQPTAEDVVPPSRRAEAGHLGRPRCTSNISLFIDTLGPIITAFSTIGTGSNGRLALVRAAREGGGGTVPSGVLLVDLQNDGPLFPLGWHLSPATQGEMRNRAECEVRTLLTPNQSAAPCPARVR